MTPAPASVQRVGGHTSIIYFHGMGTPRRYEEVSRILDCMDRYASSDAVGKVGMLRGQKVGVEPRRENPQDDPVTFFKFARFIPRPGKTAQLVGAFRLYEIFWSPATAGGLSPWGVMLWLILRTFHPFFVVTKPWRAHQRLKRTFLNRLFHDRRARPVAWYQALGRAYRDFEGMEARRRFPRGSFAEFLTFLSERHARDPGLQLKLVQMARQWRRTVLVSQLRVIFLVLTAYAALLAMVIGFSYVIAGILVRAGLVTPSAGLSDAAAEFPTYFLFPLAAALILITAAVARFFHLFLSDVVFWTTTLEKDLRYQKRQEILRAAEAMVLHVLKDPTCYRIVIMGHSLGTAIAHETLLRLGRRLKAERESSATMPGRYDSLRKITHVITFGSPIDRIAYFFNLTYSRYHRFNRVADELMGQTSDLPYRDGRARIIKWVNIRDRSDPIASRLFSPRGPLPNRDEIDEVEVSSSHFPSPGAAHTGYFNAWLSAKVVYDMAVLHRGTLQLASTRPAWSERAATAIRIAVLWSVITACWAAGLAASAHLSGLTPIRDLAALVGLSCVGLTILAWLAARILDRTVRLTLQP